VRCAKPPPPGQPEEPRHLGESYYYRCTTRDGQHRQPSSRTRLQEKYEVDKSNKRNESKSNLTIPGPVSICAVRRSPSLQSQGAVAPNAKLKSKTPTGSNLRPTDERRSTGLKSRSEELGVKDKPTSMSLEGDNEKPLKQLPIAIPRDNGRTIEEVKQNIIGSSSNLSFTSPGTVIKWSWVSLATERIESELLRDCSGLFGTPKHYYSFLACHGNDSPATNHLFLPDDSEIKSCYWNLFHRDAMLPERRGLWVYISSFAGRSLLSARSPKALIHAVFHACLGWFNLIQKGYLHRDISIGNLVMVEDAVTTKAFEILKNERWNATVEDMTEALQDLKIDSSTMATSEDKLTAALHDLGIADKCNGFVIDNDLAIKLAGYFKPARLPFGYLPIQILTASEYGDDYRQSPVDDLYSFMQWAAVFHDQDLAAKDVPFGNSKGLDIRFEGCGNTRRQN